MANARDLLLNHCAFSSVPEVGEVQQYLEQGPGFIFLFHPALGPLWDVIGQKVRGGALAPRSELVLEVAAAALTNVCVDGSLLVKATAPVGHMQAVAGTRGAAAAVAAPPPQQPYSQTSYDSLEGLFFDDSYRPSNNTLEYTTSSPQGALSADSPAAAGGGGPGSSAAPDMRLVFSSRCGRVRLTNVTVCNAGIDWAHDDNVYWRHMVARKESARITLHGNAEFEAADVLLAGDCSFDVPDGHLMRVAAGPDGRPVISVEPLCRGAASWDWVHDMAADGRISLTLREHSGGGGGSDAGGGWDDAPWWVQRPAARSGSSNGHRGLNGSVNGNGGERQGGLSLPLPSAASNGASSWWPPGAPAPGSSPECDPSWLSSQL
jgi:hypothetical protein